MSMEAIFLGFGLVVGFSGWFVMRSFGLLQWGVLYLFLLFLYSAFLVKQKFIEIPKGVNTPKRGGRLVAIRESDPQTKKKHVKGRGCRCLALM